MNFPRHNPPETSPALRADLDAALDDVIATRGPRHPLATTIATALLHGDRLALQAAWSLYHANPAANDE